MKTNPVSNRRLRRGFFRARDGSIAIEAAIMLPVVIILLLAAVDFGRLLWTVGTLEHAAREGTRFAIVHGSDGSFAATSDDDLADYVKGRAVGLQAQDVGVNVAWNPGKTRGSTVTIQLDYPFSFFTGAFLPLDPLTLRSSASMIVS